MPLRTRLFIIISLVVFIILSVSVFLLINNSKKKQLAGPVTNNPGTTKTVIDSTNIESAPLPVVQPTVVPTGVTIKPRTSAEVEDGAVRQLAKIYVERFNSYSSDNNYQNIRDVQSLVTRSYWKKISAPLSSAQKSGDFVAVTTNVVNFLTSAIENNTAIVTLKAQKTATAGGKTTTTYLDYMVTLDKIGSNWLVSDATAK